MRTSEIALKPLIRSDATATFEIAYRRGFAGKTRHVQVQYLWIQQELANEHVKLQKVLVRDNTADAYQIPLEGRARTPHGPDELLAQECRHQCRKIDHGVPAHPRVGQEAQVFQKAHRAGSFSVQISGGTSRSIAF